MRAYNIGSIVMIVVLAGFTLFIAGRLLWLGLRKKSKVEFRNYIKTYKFGKFLWVYLLAIPLFAMSYHYSGCNGFECFFKAFTSASKLLALQFDVTLDLTKVNDLYMATVILCYCIAILNLVLFVTSCVAQIAWNGLARIRFLYSRSDKCLILGSNHENELFYNSIGKKNGVKVKKIIADVLDKSGKWDLYTKNIHYHGSSSVEDLQNYIVKILDKFDKKFVKAKKKGETNTKFPKFQIILNFQDSTKNDNMCTFLSNLIGTYAVKHKKDKNKKVGNYLPYLDVYIYTDKERETLYKNLRDDFNGCLHLVSAQEVIAIDFIEKYPLAKYLTEGQINYNTSLLEKDAKISVSFIGFGKTQQEIFKLLYSHSQFVKKVDGEIVGEEIKYNVFDKTKTWDNPDFRESFNKYKYQFLSKRKANQYYPLAPMTEPVFTQTDINSQEFTDLSAKELQKHKDGNNLKYIVISLGNDFASINYANKLWSTIEDKKIPNCHLFVKINDADAFRNVSHIFAARKNKKLNSSCNVYGCISETVLNYENIIMNDMTDLAIMADALYCAATAEKPKDRKLNLVKNIVEEARNNWSYEKERDRYSSLCAVLNLRSKLLCMGYDYAKESDEDRKEVFKTYKQYWKALDKKAKFQPKLARGKSNGSKYLEFAWDSQYYFEASSRRWALVTSEHNRWDAFERCRGTIPLRKSKITSDGIYKIKKQGLNACMTTMDGLKLLQLDLIENWKTNNPKKKADKNIIDQFDKIKLDSLNIDAAWHILKKIGYKIVKKENPNGVNKIN